VEREQVDREKDGRTDGKVDMTKLGDAFCNFVNAATRESAKVNPCGNFADGT